MQVSDRICLTTRPLNPEVFRLGIVAVAVQKEDQRDRSARASHQQFWRSIDAWHPGHALTLG